MSQGGDAFPLRDGVFPPRGGMRERVHQLGGTLHIDSEDRGTTIRAMFPIAKAAAVSPKEVA